MWIVLITRTTLQPHHQKRTLSGVRGGTDQSGLGGRVNALPTAVLAPVQPPFPYPQHIIPQPIKGYGYYTGKLLAITQRCRE